MKSRILGTVVAGMVALAGSISVEASTVIANYGTFSETALYTYDGVTRRRVSTVDDVGLEQSSASTSNSGASYGDGASSTGFGGPSFLPAVSAYSISVDGSYVASRSLAVQRYTVADGVTSITVDALVDYSGSGGDPFSSGPAGWVAASLFALSSATDLLDFGTCPLLAFTGGDDFQSFTAASLCLNIPDEPTADWLEVSQLARDEYFPMPATSASVPLSITFAVNPGDTIFIGAYLSALAQGGGFVNATRTLTATLADPASATASLRANTFQPVTYPGSTVPEPGMFGLMGMGFAGLAWIRRRRAA